MCNIQKGDVSILAVTCRDTVAAKAHYHVSCYKDYTRGTSKEHKQNDADTKEHENEDKHYAVIESEAYENLFDFMRTEIIPNKEIVIVVSLTKKLGTSIFKVKVMCVILQRNIFTGSCSRNWLFLTVDH